MSSMSSLTTALSLFALGARTVLAQDYPTCLSFGMDFQNGGSYFQNSLSSDNFTFVSQFEDCQNDVAYNLLIDPVGDQTLCSDTQLQPDDTNQLSTCPIEKNQLSTGNWSIIVITNNGDGTQVAYERDFALSVGPQSTVTYTPTVTVVTSVTPVITATVSTTTTATIVANPSTVTSPSATVTPTKTVTPRPVITTTTKALLTLKVTSYSVAIMKATQTKTASCKLPTRQPRADPTAKIRVTVGPGATITGVAGGSQKFRREYWDEVEKRNFVEARAARLAHIKRAPDAQPLTVTDMNTSDYSTATVTSTAPATVVTTTTTFLTTTTSTPAPVTVLSGEATAKVVTTTIPASTITLTNWTVATTVASIKVLNYIVTVTTTTTPAAVATACKQAGGVIG